MQRLYKGRQSAVAAVLLGPDAVKDLCSSPQQIQKNVVSAHQTILLSSREGGEQYQKADSLAEL